MTMLLKDLVKKYGNIYYNEYKGSGKWEDKLYNYDEFVNEFRWIDWNSEEFEHSEWLKDDRIYKGKYGQMWFVVTNDGIRYAPTNGDYIQSQVKDDLFILMGHDGFDIYELKGYKK